MSSDPLKTLLKRADADREPALAPSEELARRVVGAVRRQKQRRVLAITVALPAVLTVLGVSAWRIPAHAPPALKDDPVLSATVAPRELESRVAHMTPAEVEHALREIAALETEAEQHLQIAHRMISDRQRDAALASARRALAEDEPAELIRERLDLVAYQMIARADRLRSEQRSTATPTAEDPAAIYREVVRLFPTSLSAAAARMRLIELDPSELPGGA